MAYINVEEGIPGKRMASGYTPRKKQMHFHKYLNSAFQ
jgi:hypothetical protein